MRISDWSSDVCSSDLLRDAAVVEPANGERAARRSERIVVLEADARQHVDDVVHGLAGHLALGEFLRQHGLGLRSEEHTSELQSLMRISYAVFCLKKQNINFILHLLICFICTLYIYRFFI